MTTTARQRKTGTLRKNQPGSWPKRCNKVLNPPATIRPNRKPCIADPEEWRKCLYSAKRQTLEVAWKYIFWPRTVGFFSQNSKLLIQMGVQKVLLEQTKRMNSFNVSPPRAQKASTNQTFSPHSYALRCSKRALSPHAYQQLIIQQLCYHLSVSIAWVILCKKTTLISHSLRSMSRPNSGHLMTPTGVFDLYEQALLLIRYVQTTVLCDSPEPMYVWLWK